MMRVSCRLYWKTGKIKVTISNTDIKAAGTSLNAALYDFIEKRNRLEESIGELEQKETRMVMDGGDLDEIHSQLAVEGDSLMKEMNQYVKTFISINYEKCVGTQCVYHALQFVAISYYDTADR